MGALLRFPLLPYCFKTTLSKHQPIKPIKKDAFIGVLNLFLTPLTFYELRTENELFIVSCPESVSS